MAKYYVESGDLKVVVQASNPIPAAAKALTWIDEHDELDLVIVVNERGFVSDRPHKRRYASDVVVETGTLLRMIAEHDLQ